MIEESENIQRIKIKLRKQESITKDKSIREQQYFDKSEGIFKIADKALSVINKTIGLNIELVEIVLTMLKTDVKARFEIVHQTYQLEKIKISENRNYKQSKNIFLNLNVQNNTQEINLIIRFYLRLSQKLYLKFMVYAKNKKYLKLISFNYIQLFKFHQELNKFQNIQNFLFFCQIIDFIIKQNELLFEFLLNLIINNELVTSIEEYYKLSQKNNIIIKQQNKIKEIKQQIISTPKKNEKTDQNDLVNYYLNKKGIFPIKKQKKSIQEIIGSLTSNMQPNQQKTYLNFKSRISIQKEKIINKNTVKELNNEVRETNQQLQKVRKQLIRISQRLKQKSLLQDQIKVDQQLNKFQNKYEQDPETFENLNKQFKKKNTSSQKFKYFRLKKKNKTNLITINKNQLNRSKDSKSKKLFIVSPNLSKNLKISFENSEISSSDVTIKNIFQNTSHKSNQSSIKQQNILNLQQGIKPIKTVNNSYLSKHKNLLYNTYSTDHKLIFEKYKQYLYPLLPSLTQQNNLIKQNKEISEIKDNKQCKENFFQSPNTSCRIISYQQHKGHSTSKNKENNNTKSRHPHKIFEIFNRRQLKLYK